MKAQLMDRAGLSSKPKPPLANPKMYINRPNKGQSKMGLVNLQVAPKQAPFKHTNRPKQSKKKEPDNRAQVNFNPSGFYEVTVQYDLCSELGLGCGLKPDDVSQALDADNAQRCAALSNPIQGNEHAIQEGPSIEFDSDEDLLSDEEVE